MARIRLPENRLGFEHDITRRVYADLTSQPEFLADLNESVASFNDPPVDLMRFDISIQDNKGALYPDYATICVGFFNRSINDYAAPSTDGMPKLDQHGEIK